MATDRFGQPIITRTPFADSLRSKYGGSTPMMGNRFNVDFTHPSNTLRPGGTMTRAGGGMSPWEQPIGGVNRTAPGAGSIYGGGNRMANPGSPLGGSADPYDMRIDPGPAPTNRTAVRPPPLPGTYGDYGASTTMQPYNPGRAMPDYGAGVTMTPIGGGPLNNLTPRFDPTQDNPWGRSGNINQGLHGLLAQLLGRGGGRF